MKWYEILGWVGFKGFYVLGRGWDVKCGQPLGIKCVYFGDVYVWDLVHEEK